MPANANLSARTDAALERARCTPDIVRSIERMARVMNAVHNIVFPRHALGAAVSVVSLSNSESLFDVE